LETRVTEANLTVDRRPMLNGRTSSSRKLLARKALVRPAPPPSEGEALEASFPAAVDTTELLASAGNTDCSTEQASVDASTLPHSSVTSVSDVLNKLLGAAVDGSSAPATTAAQPAPAPAPAWSAEDESTLQALLARRKAAGYQRRGRDVGGQLVAAGSIKPNPDTVVAVIVGIVTERGSIERAELIDAMAKTTFPHAKAQPSDKGWCQGYVAGALRNGFLTLAEQPAAAEAA
jgi:hypothetical protein